jgi:hypothetical protein
VIGTFYKEKINIQVGDLITYKKELYLVLDISVQNDRMWWLEIESINNNSIFNIPAIYVEKVCTH